MIRDLIILTSIYILPISLLIFADSELWWRLLAITSILILWSVSAAIIIKTEKSIK